MDDTSTPLSQKDKKKLRGIAQRLKPSVRVGKQGLSDSNLVEIEKALTKSELIKIRFEGDRSARSSQIPELESKTSSVCVAQVGFTAAFYRTNPQYSRAESVL